MMKPNRLSDVDQRQPADALGPELLEVGRQPDGEKGHHEEEAAEEVAFARGCLQAVL